MRGTDPAVWKRLFLLVGSPKALFEQCLQSKQVQSAASYLRILQFLEGTRESRLCALKLLEETLNTDDLELAGDLIRFLQPSEEMIELAKIKIDSLAEGEIHSIELDLDDQEYYLQELLLARYARKLLAQQQLKKLLRFAKGVSHDLKPWLIRERRRAALIDDFDTALAMLHLQFNLPYPDSVPLHRSPVIQPFPSTPRSRGSIDIEESLPNSKWELKQLLEEMLSAECIEWSLLIGTVLLDVNTIVTILKQHFSMWKAYHQTLSIQESTGYKELLSILEREVKEAPPTLLKAESHADVQQQLANNFVFT